MANSSENKDNNYNAKPRIFDGEKFDYWKDRIESFFLGFDVDLWDIVVEGYEHPKDAEGKAISRSQMTDAQKDLQGPSQGKNHSAQRHILCRI